MTTTGGQIAKFWPKNTQIIAILLIIPLLDSFGYKKQLIILIKNEARLNILTISYQTVGGNPVYDHPGGSNSTILTKIDLKYWCSADNTQIYTIKWYKAAILCHLQQSIVVFIQNKSSNNRECLSIWKPQGVKWPYFDKKHRKYNHFCNNSSIWTFGLYKTARNQDKPMLLLKYDKKL